jgi:nitrate/nitrite-specific signal transduction histidine kinase
MNKITTQIKIIGLSLSLIAIALILLTLNLNQKSKNDSIVVNIAGKERMLTQKMAKELLLNSVRSEHAFEEFEAAKAEFLANLSDLTNGNEKTNITPPPSDDIRSRLQNIKHKSDLFFAVSEKIKNGDNTKQTIDSMYLINNELLKAIDDTVWSYTREFEAKKERLQILQYVGGALIFMAVMLSMYLTKKIEVKFDKFLSETKEIGALKCDEHEAIIDAPEGSGELDQAKNELKSFMRKVEKVVSKAQKALDESQNAIAELEASTKTIETRLKDGKIDENTKKEMESYIDKSEDLTITSLEDIACTKEMLQKFSQTLSEINKKIE